MDITSLSAVVFILVSSIEYMAQTTFFGVISSLCVHCLFTATFSNNRWDFGEIASLTSYSLRLIIISTIIMILLFIG